MKKALFLVVSFWLASPAAAQALLKMGGVFNGFRDAAHYAGPAPTGPGMVFFNGVDVWPYVQQASPASTTPSIETSLVITGSLNGVTNGSNFIPPAAAARMIFFNGIDIYAYTHPPIAPTPAPVQSAAPAPPAAAPAPAPAAAPIATSTAAIKNANPAAAAVPDQSAAKARTAAAEARKKKFERLSKRLDALADKLGASKINAGKKSALLAQVKNLAAQLKDPAGKLTVEAAEEALAKLNDDFAEAAESAGSKP